MAQTTKPLPGWDFNSLAEIVGVPTLVEGVGVQRVIQAIGVQRVIQEVGPERLIQELGVQGILSKLTPEQREAFKRGLSEGNGSEKS